MQQVRQLTELLRRPLVAHAAPLATTSASSASPSARFDELLDEQNPRALFRRLSRRSAAGA